MYEVNFSVKMRVFLENDTEDAVKSWISSPFSTVVVDGTFIGSIFLLIVVPAPQALFLDRFGSPVTPPEGEPAAVQP